MKIHAGPLAMPLSLSLLLLCACGGSGSPQATDVPKVPRIDVTASFTSTTMTVYSTKLEWAPDGSRVAFEGTGGTGGGSDIYTLLASPGATPSAITHYDTVSWEGGGETPAYTSGGILAYYTGWIGADQNMHLMAATAGQVANVPAPSIYRHWNGSDVGIVANAASSPELLTLSGDGTRAVVQWNSSCWLLDWAAGASPVATQLSLGTDCVLSRDGLTLASRKTTGEVAFRAVAGGAETVLGSGSEISWAQGGRLGFVVSGGYRVYTIGTATSITYATTAGLQCAALSWDGTKVAFRTFGGASTGVSIGTLVNP